jgi:hypothetical protein
MRFVVQSTGNLPKGERYRFQIQQSVKDAVVGGSVYLVAIEGERTGDGRGTVEFDELSIKERLAQVRLYQQGAVAERIRESRRS